MAGKSPHSFARVVFALPVDRPFDYAVPTHLLAQLRAGQRVLAPFGARKLAGYCVELVDQPDVPDRCKLKAIYAILDELPLLSPGMLRLTRWIAEYYCCSWGEALQSAIPGSVRSGRRERTITVVQPALSSQELQSKLPAMRKRAPKRARLLELLDSWQGDATLYELAHATLCTPGVIKAAERKGLVRLARKPAPADPFHAVQPAREPPLAPTPEQQQALTAIRKLLAHGDGGPALVHGVTGSGKTEVYLQAIADVVRAGHQAIVLVPEIALTPQTVRRFRARFSRVAVLHSHLSDADRYEQWRAIAAGRADVIIGARSAIFAPAPSLGLIVVDEEHETSFKQDNAPRYHARDVAVVRGAIEHAVVVLGSATPSLESYRNALTGKYRHVELASRVESRPMPAVQIVDMARESDEVNGLPLLSRQLENYIADCLARREQVILFLNRRGFSTLVTCALCHHVLRCEHCAVPLTYHRRLDRAICHHCGYEVFANALCPECHTTNVRFRGMGTERVEEAVARRFPDARLLRMDSDTMRGRGAHERALAEFAAGQTDIMVGTQMIAKGLDFPNVTLVGVLGADMMLNLPDFRSCERTFQLLAQVSGRTGRGPKGGRVVVQSYVADHYSITYAARHDYKAFAKRELEHRRQLRYPPYGRLVKFVVQGKQEPAVRRRATELADLLKRRAPDHDARVMGPAECPIAKIRDRYRWQILVKVPQSRAVRAIVREASKAVARKAATRIIVDVDPVVML